MAGEAGPPGAPGTAAPPEDAAPGGTWIDIPIDHRPGPSDGDGWTELEWEPDDGHVVLQQQGVFERLFGGRFGRLLLPAIVAQSILIGGGYASGREVVAFGARFGALGWIAALTIFIGFALISMLVFEFARVTQAYDYKSFMKGLIGPAWPLFDLVFAAMAVLVIAVMASAAGTIMKTTLGVPYIVGILTIVLIVAVLTYHGAKLIETFKTIGTTALYIGYILFSVVVLGAAGTNVSTVFTSGDTSFVPVAETGNIIWAGILYVGYNLALYPAVLFTLHRQTRTRDSVLAGAVAGVLMTIPFVLTYLSVLAFYPDPAVLGADVPWLAMLDATGGPWIVVLFGLVVGWTLMETSVGLIHAIVDRVERDLPVRRTPTGTTRRLPGWQKGLFGSLVLLAAALLAQVGIIDLVSVGYTWMGYAFLVLFALPLLSVGAIRIVRERSGPVQPAPRGPLGPEPHPLRSR